jgi:hypothetical protein
MPDKISWAPQPTQDGPANEQRDHGGSGGRPVRLAVAGNALRTFDATRQVTVAWPGCEISAAQPSVRGSLQRLALRLAT